MIDIEQLNDRFRVSHFGKDGKVNFKDIAIPKTEKYKWELAGSSRKDPFFLSWDGKPVKKTQAGYLGKFRTEEFFASLPDEVTKDIYEFNQPEVWFCDIEVEVGEEFPDPGVAATPVLAVALVNSLGQSYVFGTKNIPEKIICSLEDAFFHLQHIIFRNQAMKKVFKLLNSCNRYSQGFQFRCCILQIEVLSGNVSR